MVVAQDFWKSPRRLNTKADVIRQRKGKDCIAYLNAVCFCLARQLASVIAYKNEFESLV